MRLLSLIALGTASVSASPDAVDEILRKLSANSSNSSDTAAGSASSSQAASSASASGNSTSASGGASASSNSTASSGGGSTSSNSSSVATTVPASTVPATTVMSGNATEAATTVAATTVAASATTVAASATTVASSSNTTTGNTTNATTAPDTTPKRKLETSTTVNVFVPTEVKSNATLLNAFEDMLGSAFGDVVCGKISNLFGGADKCKCAAARTGTDTWTWNADKTHKCIATVPTTRRRAEATRRLSTTTAVETSSEVELKVTTAQSDKYKTDMDIKATDLNPLVVSELGKRITAAPASLQVLKDLKTNFTDSITTTGATPKSTEVATTTAATAGAVAAASTGLGLLIAALLF